MKITGIAAACSVLLAVGGCTTTPPFVDSAGALAVQICKFSPTVKSLNDVINVSKLDQPIAIAQLICDLVNGAKKLADAAAAKDQNAGTADLSGPVGTRSGGPIVAYSLPYKGIVIQGTFVK